MKSIQIIIFTMLTIFIITSSIAVATPSTIIWIPSVDFQAYKSFHLGIDNYAYDFKNGKAYSGTAFPTDLGLTVGVLPSSTVQAEIGVDYFTPLWSPFSLNAKIGVPEGAISDWSPALAVGGFGFGFSKNVTDYNIVYGIAGKTFPVIGRIEVGYFSGNDKLLVDLSSGSADNSGILLSWDRMIPEISENLWLAVDYQGGKSSFGALSYGVAWSFSKNVSVIFARDVFNADIPSVFTMQLDINI
ncbi:MAG: hypothetical protein EHM64_09755 [Ignavibacteriae bacterium]|nr:MAG: hypothetical protein EHM64_09755 [Ignavibacteriota bacterium]